jgi:hypothetical protein
MSNPSWGETTLPDRNTSERMAWSRRIRGLDGFHETQIYAVLPTDINS